jgi:protein associated with RNAse G/E
MVDLDLDVLRERWGQVVKLVDEDEFVEHQVRYAYPPDVVEVAEASSRWLLAAVEARSGPFGGAHQAWLDLVA